jgi:hypothetical protein
MRKPRTKQQMVDFLMKHFRYDTMSSWNRADSYATKIKAHSLGLTLTEQDAVYAMLDVQDSHQESGFNAVLSDFDRRHNFSYQIGVNGRSGGYLVLCSGGSKPSEHKSQCRKCGQRNFQTVEVEPGQCGKCHAQARYNRAFQPETFTNPGQGIDMDGDFAEWDTSSLKQRVDLVWDFDKTCQRAVRAYVNFALENKVVEETVFIPKTVRVAVER